MRKLTSILRFGALSMAAIALRVPAAEADFVDLAAPPLPGPTVTVTAPVAETTEGGIAKAVFKVQRNSDFDTALTVLYRLGGSAVNAVDYDNLPRFVTFPRGASAVEVVVSAIDDKIAEETESVSVTLLPPFQPAVLAANGVALAAEPPVLRFYTVGDAASVTLKIADNDLGNVATPTVGIAATVPTTTEGSDAPGEFTVSRLGGTAAALKVGYQILTDSMQWPPVDGLPPAPLIEHPVSLIPPAKNGADYKELSGVVEIPAGEKSAKILVLAAVDEERGEAREHVTLKLKPSNDYNINAPDQATVLIGNTDPKLSVELAEPEDGAVFAGGEAITLRALPHAGSSPVLKVEFFDGDRSIGSVPGGDVVPVNFSILWKDAPGGQRVLTAAATDASGSTAKSKPVRITVLRADAPPVVRIFTSQPIAQGGNPELVGAMKVVRTGNFKTKLNVRYAVSGDARPNVDYQALPGVITIPAGEASAAILIKPVVHNSIIGKSSVIVTLEQLVFVQPPPPEDDYIVGRPKQATVTVIDDFRNLPAKVGIDAPTAGQQFRTGTDIKVAISTADADGYVPRMELLVDGNVVASETRQFFVKPPPGQIEHFDLIWQNATPGVRKLSARATDDRGEKSESAGVEIIVTGDVKLPVVTIKATTPEVLESNPARPGRFRVDRTGSTRSKLEVLYSIAGTAENGGDYAKLSGSLIIPAGQDSAEILVVPLPDKAKEGTETVALTLQPKAVIAIFPPPEDFYVIGDPKSAAVKILEQPVSERPPKVDIVEPRNGSEFVEKTDVILKVQAADADGYIVAVELFDGKTLVGSEKREYITPPRPGTLAEFKFTLKSPALGDHALTARATDDGGNSSVSSPVKFSVNKPEEPNVVTIVASDPEAREGESRDTAAFKVTRTGSLRSKLDVHFALSGSAQNGIDYERLSGVVSIRSGEASAAIVVKALADKLVEGKELVTAALVPSPLRIFPPPYSVGEPSKGEVTILDPPPLNNLPKVAIVTPADEAEFPVGANIDVKVEAADSDGKVVGISLLIDSDGKMDFKVEPAANVTAGLVINALKLGKHVLRAQATDDRGGVSKSSPVTLVVRDPLAVPFVKRDLPDNYTPGEKLKVVLEAKPLDVVQAYAVEEKPPRGWTVGVVSEGGALDPATRELKFGPFFDNKARTFAYELTPPAGESGRKEFGGVGSANGVNSVIGGDTQITSISTAHPADRDSADQAITAKELTAYGLAWKSGKEWPVGPNPIPQDYLTRAAFLWKSGEAYQFDASQGPAPLWWVPASKPSTESGKPALALAAVSPAGNDRSAGKISRSMVMDAQGVVTVTLKVSPKQGVSAQTLEEKLPEGWAATKIDQDGTFDVRTRTVRWGIYFDDRDRTLTYQIVTAATVVNDDSIRGAGSFDGAQVETRSQRGNKPLISSGRWNSIRRHASGECELSIQGESGKRYKVQVSTNLIDWRDLGTISSATGELQVLDTESADAPIRYYRAVAAD